jgi:hypothetical protein
LLDAGQRYVAVAVESAVRDLLAGLGEPPFHVVVDLVQVDEPVAVAIRGPAEHALDEVLGEQAGTGRRQGVVGQGLAPRTGDDVLARAAHLLGDGTALEHPAAAAVQDDDRPTGVRGPDEPVDVVVADAGTGQPVRPGVPAAEVQMIVLVQQSMTAVVEEHQIVALARAEELVQLVHDLVVPALGDQPNVLVVEQACVAVDEGAMQPGHVLGGRVEWIQARV